MDLLRFVDSITAAPSLRLDLNDGVTWGLRYEGTDMSPPPLRQSWSGTLLADGELQSAAAYANRRIRLSLDLITVSVDAAAAQMQILWRELNRPSNVLMWQPEGATQAVFFRTLRSSDNQVTEFPGAGGLRAVAVEIVAEPFGYGLKQTSAVTVNNDPAAPGNGMFFDITAVKGDVETPLQLRFALPTPVNIVSALGVRRRGTPSAMPTVLQAEDMTAGVDTSVQANDPTMSGAGSNYMRCTFATLSSAANRILAPRFPLVATADARGTYRVFVRCRQTVGGDVINLRFRYGYSDGGSSNYSNDPVVHPGTTNRMWVDLGLVSIPAGPDPVFDGYSGSEIAVRGLSVGVEATRVSGTGGIDFDCLLFVPADDRYTTWRWPTEGEGPDNLVLDGPTDTIYTMEGTSEIRTPNVPKPRTGGLPYVSPGVTNRIVLVYNNCSAGAGFTQQDSKTDTVAITVAYWPRYLYVRPATS